jgi:AraC family transcriptional regulator, transcriptional activator of pobA
MDEPRQLWYLSDMNAPPAPIPIWQLYGEDTPFPDVLHVERIADRAAGLDWTIAPHRHVHLHQIFLLQSGHVKLALDGADVAITPPMVINVPRSHVHGFSFSRGTEGFVLTLPAKDFPDLFGPEAEMGQAAAQPFVVPAGAEIAAQFERMAESHATITPYRRTVLRAAAATLLGMVLVAQARNPVAIPPKDRSDPRVIAFQAKVRAGLHEKLGVEDYARALGVSARHLSRLCTMQTGLSAKTYVETERIREGCRLLVYTRLPIQGVAYHLGFDDPAYFSRAFRRQIGMSPGAYRARFDQ